MAVHRRTSRWSRRKTAFAGAFVALVTAGALGMSGSAIADDGGVSDAPILGIWEVQSLNGINNNPFVPTLAAAGQRYLRLGPARYADGKSQPVSGPNTRNISNREFNDVHQNLFSERNVAQIAQVWGQFIDHDFGLRQENGTTANIPFSATDPLETFRNDLGVIPFVRSAAAPGTGVTNTRQHINTISTFIDASMVYGLTDTRLDWLRNGTVDGNPDNNSATLLMPGNYLPRRDSRGNPAAAPTMAIDGRLLANPNKASVAGDVRANESLGLNTMQTLFAREHNRIVSLLPTSISAQDRFQLARAVVIAEIQNITYSQFLPAMGVFLPAYQGYNQFLDPTLAHEFATVGYRAHSIIHGEVETDTNVSRYSQATLDALEAQGIEVEVDGADVHIGIPQNIGFFNPDLTSMVQLGPLLSGLAGESEYRNDEQIDNQLRSVLFKVPVSGNPDCLDGPTLPDCFNGVVDLGAIDIERGRDHGMPTYNQLRQTYGLPAKTSFTSITGESTDQFPTGLGINSPQCLDFVALFDINGNPLPLGDNDNATRGVRRCTLAAKLRAIYGGNINAVDAFVGMVAERHLFGVEMGELQLATWKDQFGAARDGDRFFYLNDPLQDFIKNNFGIDSHKTLAQVIAANTDVPLASLASNVFRPPVGAAATSASALSADSATSSTGSGINPGRNMGSSATKDGARTQDAPAPSDTTRHAVNGTAATSTGGRRRTGRRLPS